MEKKQFLLISMLLYCFGVVLAFVFLQTMGNDSFLYTYLHCILVQAGAIAISCFLFHKNKKANQYLFKPEKIQQQYDFYNKCYFFLKILLLLQIMSIFLPLWPAYMIESTIGELFIAAADWIEHIFQNLFQMDIYNPVYKLVDVFSLRCVFLFLESYIFCELHHFKKQTQY